MSYVPKFARVPWRKCARPLPSIRQALQSVAKNPCDVPKLEELFDQVHALADNPSLTRLPTIARVVDAFEHLLKQLVDKPDCVNQSVQRTMAQTVDLLCALFDGDGREVDLVTARALAVDDQQIALRSVMHALEKANLKSQALSDPAAALSVAQEWQFDLIVLDIEMPGMTGWNCARSCAPCRTTRRRRSCSSPALRTSNIAPKSAAAAVTIVIAKPFLATELGLKALALIVKSKTSRRSGRPTPDPDSPPAWALSTCPRVLTSSAEFPTLRRLRRAHG